LALLNAHQHFHCPVVECVFKADASGAASFHESRLPIKNHWTKCRPSMPPSAARVDPGVLLAPEDAETMANPDHGGGLVADASVRIQHAGASSTLRRQLSAVLDRHCHVLEGRRESDAEDPVIRAPSRIPAPRPPPGQVQRKFSDTIFLHSTIIDGCPGPVVPVHA